MDFQPMDFSVIIPTYNRPQRLQECLQSMAALSFPRDRFEVIVVDDGSAEPLQSVIEAFQLQLNLVLLCQANAGPAAARNRGAQQAQGKFLAFTDDDCKPEQDWLNKLMVIFEQFPQALIGGSTENLLVNNLYSQTSQTIADVVYAHYNAVHEAARFFASNNMAMARTEFSQIGGFNQAFRTSEDRELCDRWLHSGRSLFYAPHIIIYHAHPMNLKQFWDQHFSYGQGAFRFHQLRAKKGWGQFEIEGNYYLKILRCPFNQGAGWQAIALGWALLVSQVANAAGFFWEMGRRRFAAR